MTTTCRYVVQNVAAVFFGLVCLTQALGAETPLRPTLAPVRVRLSEDLQRVAARTVERSPTFRSQLDRLERAPRLVVTARFDPAIDQHSYRARSVIHRLRNGELLAIVSINPRGNAVEWLAHEFEHILEQVEGLHLPSLARRTTAIWRTGNGEMFETDRAIRAGRRVVEETRKNRSTQTFLSKKGYREDEIVGTISGAP
jgi:hypothetical protein